MSKLVFHVQGSAVEPYTVVIERDGENLRATCDCDAGLKKQYCKHRFRLFEGNSEGLMGGDVGKLSEVPILLRGTDVEAAMAEVKRAEHDEAEAKKWVQGARKSLAKAMLD